MGRSSCLCVFLHRFSPICQKKKASCTAEIGTHTNMIDIGRSSCPHPYCCCANFSCAARFFFFWFAYVRKPIGAGNTQVGAPTPASHLRPASDPHFFGEWRKTKLVRKMGWQGSGGATTPSPPFLLALTRFGCELFRFGCEWCLLAAKGSRFWRQGGPFRQWHRRSLGSGIYLESCFKQCGFAVLTA